MKVGTARTIITPDTPVWLAGYDSKRELEGREPEGVLHDLWVKALALEKNHPQATALFFTGCGADQNPLPRRRVDLCQRYGNMLATAVEEVLEDTMGQCAGGLYPVAPRFQ